MKDGKIWICTNMGGVSILDLQHNAFISAEEIDFQNIKATNDNYGLSSPNARCAYQDCYGNIWIGNYREVSISLVIPNPCSIFYLIQ